MLLADLPHDVVHVDVCFLVMRLKLNAFDAAEVRQVIVVHQHKHDRQIGKAVRISVKRIKVRTFFA